MELDPGALKSLFMLCFPDETLESTDFIFSSLLKGSFPVVKYSGKTPVSMLFLIETDLILSGKTYPVYYLYAACTHPDYRGQGFMHELLKEANQAAATHGKQGIFLRPATPSLISFYKTAGYLPYFTNKTIDFQLSQAPNLSEDYHQITSAEEFRSTRNKLLSSLSTGFVDWKAECIRAALNGALTLGGGAFSDNPNTASAFLLYEQDGDTLFVRELLALTDLDKFHILNFALRETGLKKAVVRTISDDDHGDLFGMLVTENKELLSTDLPQHYQGLAFD